MPGEHHYADLELAAQMNANMVFGSIMGTCSTYTGKWKRLVCYALAELHMKNTTTKPFIHQANTLLGSSKSLKNKTYNARRIGNRWKAIVSWVSRESDQPLTGILLVLDKPSSWERYAESEWRTALDNLPNRLDILCKAKEQSKLVDNIVKEVKNHIRFITPLQHMMLGCEGSKEVRNHDTRSIVMASEAVTNPRDTGSADAECLMMLLAFLANQEIPTDLLYRGASPRKRWDEGGEIVGTDAAYLGLSDDLIRICSPEKLPNTLSKLQSMSVIIWISKSNFKLVETERNVILRRLPSSTYSFWRLQALILASRSIPWKYLEKMELDTALFVSHIRYALDGIWRCCKVEDITPMTRIDIALNLIESARFSVMEWKQFAIRQARELTVGLNDSYTRSCLALRQCLLHRLSGEPSLAFTALTDGTPYQANKRSHAIYGHTIIQRALNHIQLDQLTNAIDMLEEWQPTSHPYSAMEQVVLFRQNLIMGKALRYQGNFTKSLIYLQRSQSIVNTTKDLIFLEDASDLACNFADTYLELDDPAKAENCLQATIKHQVPKQGALFIALAECLFAQRRFLEVDETLRRVFHSQLKLMKMDKLRLAILQAKLSHIRFQFGEAFRYWTEAMSNLRRFTLASGRTRRIILLSQCHVLHSRGLFDIEHQTRNQLDALDECADEDGASYWISGLRHWLGFLESCNWS